MEETFKLTDKEKSNYIMDFIQLEKSIGIQELNGVNYKDVCPEAIKKGQLKEWMMPHLEIYESTARTVLRGAWFFDFVENILNDFVEKRDQSMVSICHESYADNLSNYHNWFMRQAGKLAINLVNSREAFVSNISAEQSKLHQKLVLDEEIYKDFKEMLPYISKITQYIWSYYAKEQMDNLP